MHRSNWEVLYLILGGRSQICKAGLKGEKGAREHAKATGRKRMYGMACL
jgi:hypothetical protein